MLLAERRHDRRLSAPVNCAKAKRSLFCCIQMLIEQNTKINSIRNETHDQNIITCLTGDMPSLTRGDNGEDLDDGDDGNEVDDVDATAAIDSTT